MLLDTLNAEQRKVAEKFEGPILVLAGAGSGKTKAVTYRIANLIQNNVKPYKILALTFTNKAAKEMKNRIAKLVENEVDQIWIHTFHSFCVRILRRCISEIGYDSSFTIYDDDDQKNIISKIIKDLDLDDKIYSTKLVKSIINSAKNTMVSADEWFANSDKTLFSDNIHNIFVEYNKRLKRYNSLDFNDLLLKVIELFQKESIIDHYANQFDYIHVDEYQDTNRAQYEIIRLLCKNKNNICVVGDDDQSIYGWRGADINNILDFESDFDNTCTIKLEQNYRSTKSILNAANSVVVNNENRKDKKLWTDNNEGDKITLYTANTERGEAAWICDTISNLVSETNSYKDIAILYRTNSQSRVLEEMLIRSKIPHRIFGASRFYDRKEIKDVIAYLRLMINPNDDISLRRIINIPKRSIGTTTIDLLSDWSNQNNISLYDSIFNTPPTLSSRPYKCILTFGDLLKDIKKKSQEMQLQEFVEYMIDKVGLIEQYKDDFSEDARNRISNIEELVAAVTDFSNTAENATLEAYLENISLVTDLDKADANDDSVSLMTLHSAKGLEFDTVFLSGMEEGIFPSIKLSKNSLTDEENEYEKTKLEEERRLCYVGITRARKKLYLTHSNSRIYYNQTMYNKPSRFLSEIPESLLETSTIDRRKEAFSDISEKTILNPKNKKKFEKKPFSGFGFSKDDFVMPNDVNKIKYSPIQTIRSTPFSLNPKDLIKDFKPGDRVDHFTYGEGNIVSITGKGSDARIVVEFTAYGKKTFSINVAPLRKINRNE